MKFRFLILFLTFSVSIQAQRWANNWFFGKNQGFEFSNNIASQTTGAQDAFEASASISDIAGNLLFYTDGLTIFNKNHQVLLNGASIEGNRSATQGALFIPKPGSSHIYYLFTLDDTLNNAFSLKYSEIDLRLDGGNGGVTSKKNVLLISGLSERMAATFNADASGVWLTVRDAFTPTFYTLSVTLSGLSGQILYSQVGSATSNNLGVQIGQMKYSTDGAYLAWVCRGDQFFEILSFNNRTGLIEQSLRKVQLNLPSGAAAYGIEFSPDRSKLYLSAGNGGLFQYDLSHVQDAPAFETSMQHLNPGNNHACLGLQLAPDKRLYVAGGNSTSTIHVVSHPNKEASLVGMSFNIIQPQSGLQIREGLPAFISNYFVDPLLIIENKCVGQSVLFTNRYQWVDSIHWYFGDPRSGNANFSNDIKASHVYSVSDIYLITRILFQGSARDTLRTDLFVNPLPEFSLGNDTAICGGTYLDLQVGLLDVELVWNDGSKMPTLRADNEGIYWVDVWMNGCVKRDSIYIQERSVNLDFAITTINHCEGRNAFVFQGSSKDSIVAWEYDFGDGNKAYQKESNHTFGIVGEHIVRLKGINPLGCEQIISKPVQVYPKHNAAIRVNDDKQCFSSHLFEIELRDTTNRSSFQFEMLLSDGSRFTQTAIQHRFTVPGIFTVKSITETDKGCKDSAQLALTLNPGPLAAFIIDSSHHCTNDAGIFVKSISEGTNSSIVSTSFSCNNQTVFDQQARFVFDQAAAYDVVLEVTDQDGCTSGKTEGFTIYPAPIVNFTIDNNAGCVGNAELQFLNFSSVSQGFVNEYNWDFGDGTESQLKEPRKQYLLPQVNTVTLVATTNKGCVATAQQIVNSYPQPKANFAIEVLDSCLFGNAVSFVNQSSYPGFLTNHWNLEGKTFQTKDLSNHSFSSSGKKLITLKVEGNAGCRDSISKELSIAPSPMINLVLNEDAQCLDGNLFNATLLNPAPSERFEWRLSDGQVFSGNQVNFSLPSAGIYSLHVVATNQLGCASSIVDTLVVYANPQPEFWVEDICVSNPAFFRNQTEDFNQGTGSWIYGDGRSGSLSDSVYQYQSPGVYEVTLHLISEHGCEGNRKSFLHVKPEPETYLTYKKHAYNREKGETVYSFSCTLQPSEEARWYVNQEFYGEGEEILIAFKDSGMHKVELRVSNSKGCTSTKSEHLYVALPFELFLPTAFTPNGDGVNDVFLPGGDIQLKSYNMIIVNRWGAVVFHSNQLESGWDGKFAGSLVEPGVYSVVVRIIDLEGEERKINGSVLLVY